MAFRLTVNLGNSIIGVSILTMPYCFRSCGIVLSILIIIISGLLNRLGCHLLFRSAVLSRKRGFEAIALETLGPIGKLLVELCVLGFLLGTCVAYFVVIGDLGPSIVSDIIGVPNSPHLRTFTMTFVGMFIALPLGLLRRVDSLSSFSVLSFGLYLFVVLKLLSEASIHFLLPEESSSPLSSSNISSAIVWWDFAGLLNNLPIFAMALSCQTQLFELLDVSQLNFEDYNAVSRLNRIVRRAVLLCSCIYISVGLFGYVAFHDKPFGGNILSFLPASLGSTIAKVGFVATIAVSLPLCLFPCRTSLYSLFIRSRDSRASLLNDFTVTPSSAYMSDRQFRFLTILLLVVTICLSVIVPHIEFVLSIVGSTTGATICFILPGVIYSRLTQKETTERILSRFLTYVGIFILIACTYSTLHTGQETLTSEQVDIRTHHDHPKIAVNLGPIVEPIKDIPHDLNKQVDKNIKKEEELLEKLQKQQEEHKKLINEQKEILREMKKQGEIQPQDKENKEIKTSNQANETIPENQVHKLNASESENKSVKSDSLKSAKESSQLSNQPSIDIPQSSLNMTKPLIPPLEKKKIISEAKKKLSSSTQKSEKKKEAPAPDFKR